MLFNCFVEEITMQFSDASDAMGTMYETNACLIFPSI